MTQELCNILCTEEYRHTMQDTNNDDIQRRKPMIVKVYARAILDYNRVPVITSFAAAAGMPTVYRTNCAGSWTCPNTQCCPLHGIYSYSSIKCCFIVTTISLADRIGYIGTKVEYSSCGQTMSGDYHKIGRENATISVFLCLYIEQKTLLGFTRI